MHQVADTPSPAHGPLPQDPPYLTLTFQQGVQDGHVHILLAILALPEDGQQLSLADDVLDLPQM